ncbi:hypothetical protein C7964_106162 [Loktanella sp. PT4BL]|jgi:hypothetical protein|uniref:hypothetical protein n=1 Tax=Loktanella sp. PT4BL TaxID=2135611 RepID=UPI000D7644B6|nr:hypothetical protein [Loktanella sp. PT4BL]PXW67586.1 hypothetical protein C7964_106162 [Loktanella sp. PT4BL]
MLFLHNLARGKAPQLSMPVLAIAIGLGIAMSPSISSFAFAEGHEDGETTHSGGPKGPGGQGGSDGHTSGGHDSDGDDHTDHEGGQGGPKNGGQGQGEGEGQGQNGSGASGQGSGQVSGRPVWAQEGIPEVELGRLNVARSPDQVLDRAYAEALGSMTPEVLTFYGRTLEGMITELSLNWDQVSFIDSPLQNLALLREALDSQSVLTTQGINPNNDTLMAAFLGSASDKEIPITANTVLALTAILDSPVTAEEAAALAADAERIRIAILAGHG